MKTIFQTISIILAGMATICIADEKPKDFPPNPLLKPGWVLTTHDEFDGSVLDNKLWIPEYFPGRFKKPKMSNHEVKDGALLIHSGPGVQTFNCHNLHKRYFTPKHEVPTIDNFTQLYGFYEIRAKHSLACHHIAFWVLEAKPGGAEIDITEDKGYGGPNWHIPLTNRVKHMCYNDITTHKQRCESFHLYSFEVYEKGVRMYHDNQLIEEAEIDWKQRGEIPLMFILGIYENKRGGQPYTIDYFRAYRKAKKAL